MNTPENTTSSTPTAARPLGLWLKVIDRRLTHAMDELFTEYGIGRRDWRRLNVIARGVGGEQMLARLAARPEKIESLREHGWVIDSAADSPATTAPWTLTTEGERVYAELLEKVTALRGRVAGAASPEDFATTLATLEAIARELGWNEEDRMRGGFGRRGGRGGRDGHSRGDRGRRGHGRRGHGRNEHSAGHPSADAAS